MTSRNVLATLVVALSVISGLGATRAPDRVLLTGHVLARVQHLTGYLKNSLGGQRYDVFVFGIGKWERETGMSTVPVKVVYEFYRDEPKLPDKFFNFSSRYTLTSVRDTQCDESVKSLSHEANVSVSEEPLPETYILKLLDGAPPNLLKPDLILPCFVLRPGQYRLLDKDNNS